MTGLLNEDKDEKKILTHVNGAIGHVVFNNPQRHNAVSLEMWDMVEQALSTFASDETIRVVVLSGQAVKCKLIYVLRDQSRLLALEIWFSFFHEGFAPFYVVFRGKATGHHVITAFQITH